MRQIKFGKYCKYQNKEFEIIIYDNNVCKLVYRGKEYNENLKKIGFFKYAESVYILNVKHVEDIQSAYYIRTYANYKSYICELLDITNNIAALNPSLEYQAMSGDHAMHGYDPQLYVAENELKDIWEERKPIEGFKFDVEPIVYLKKDGIWLVKE